MGGGDWSANKNPKPMVLYRNHRRGEDIRINFYKKKTNTFTGNKTAL